MNRCVPQEAEERGACLWCGGETYAGERVLRGPLGQVHRACLADFLADCPGLTTLAALCGYEEELA